jgi:small nuclear ribonucleoprotein (snRNP)-like protein
MDFLRVTAETEKGGGQSIAERERTAVEGLIFIRGSNII